MAGSRDGGKLAEWVNSFLVRTGVFFSAFLLSTSRNWGFPPSWRKPRNWFSRFDFYIINSISDRVRWNNRGASRDFWIRFWQHVKRTIQDIKLLKLTRLRVSEFQSVSLLRKQNLTTYCSTTDVEWQIFGRSCLSKFFQTWVSLHKKYMCLFGTYRCEQAVPFTKLIKNEPPIENKDLWEFDQLRWQLIADHNERPNRVQ